MGLVMAFICCENRFLPPHDIDVSALSICIVLRVFCADFYVFVVCEFEVDSRS